MRLADVAAVMCECQLQLLYKVRKKISANLKAVDLVSAQNKCTPWASKLPVEVMCKPSLGLHSFKTCWWVA